MAKRIYFIGIGGISMSSLAVFYAVKGNVVEGSDISQCENLKELTTFGIKYNIGHYEKNIKKFNPNIVVINCAINEENPELKWAIKKNKKIISRAEALGKLCKDFKNVIAISGTHGKTTTTALLSEIFIKANTKPTIHVGGILKSCGSNFLIGDRKYFITEACEYKNSFLSLKPSFGVVLNIEPDHLDFFKNITEIKKSFSLFLNSSKTQMFKKDDFSYIVKSKQKTTIFSAKNVNKNEQGYYFDFYKNEMMIARIQTNFSGLYNVKNSLVACAIANHYKIKTNIIKQAVKNFKGVKRRYERITKISGAVVIHDYAHHPTEIKKVIEQSKRYGKVLTVFQPHTFSRTKKLMKDFLNCFNQSTSLLIIKTYPARENEIKGATAKDLFENIINKNKKLLIIKKEKNILKNTKNKYVQYEQKSVLNIKNLKKFNQEKIKKICLKNISYSNDFSSAKEYILKNAKNYDCILILGAGDVDELAYMLKKYKK